MMDRPVATLQASVANAVALLFFALPLAAEEWVDGVVVFVNDGDTAVVETTTSRTLRVRFYGVDAPELANDQWPRQSYGDEAARFMRALLLDHKVGVRLVGDRTHGREVGEIFVDGRSATRELIRAGLGWWNRKFAPDDRDLARLQKVAQKTRKGLWRERDPVPPWRYRSQHRHRSK